MSKEQFDHLMKHYSAAAEAEQAVEARNAARRAKRDKIRHVVMALLVVALLAYVAMNHAVIRDTVARWFPHQESEYEQIHKLTDDVNAQNGSSTAGNGREARLKSAIQAAQNHAAVVDSVMDDTPSAKPKAAH